MGKCNTACGKRCIGCITILTQQAFIILPLGGLINQRLPIRPDPLDELSGFHRRANSQVHSCCVGPTSLEATCN